MNAKQRTIGFAAPLLVREAADGAAESRTIEGYALLFGVRSQLINDFCGRYFEQLDAGCVTRSLLDGCDIKLTLFHDRQLVLARSNKGRGTLSYEIDEKGVLFRADMPRTADGDKALELIRRGDLAGCSFCYSTDEGDPAAVSYVESEDADGEPVALRLVHRIDAIYDFTLTTDPAYEQTTVERREVERALAAMKPAAAPAPAPAADPQARREAVRALRLNIHPLV